MAWEIIPEEWMAAEHKAQVLKYLGGVGVQPRAKKWAYWVWARMVGVKVTVDDLYYAMYGRQRRAGETIEGGLREAK